MGSPLERGRGSGRPSGRCHDRAPPWRERSPPRWRERFRPRWRERSRPRWRGIDGRRSRDDRPPITTREALATGWAATRRAAGSAAAATAAARTEPWPRGGPGRTGGRACPGRREDGTGAGDHCREPRPTRSRRPRPRRPDAANTRVQARHTAGVEVLPHRRGNPAGRRQGRGHAEHSRRPDERLPGALPATDGAYPHRDQSRQAIGILAALVIVAFVIAWFNLPPIFGGPSDSSPRPRPTTTTKPAPSTTTSVGPAPAALAIKTVTSPDPEGDGREGDNRLARAWDKDPATFWYSSTYVSSSWSGLQRRRGHHCRPGAAHVVNAVTVTMHGRQSLRVPRRQRTDKSGATLLGAISGDGALTVKAARRSPPGMSSCGSPTRPTSVPGQYRAEVSEVTVLGGP